MLATFAASMIPLVTAGQIVALGALWRRYRMAGSGWWLLATVLIFLGTAAQAIEEAGWRSLAVTAAVNTLCVWGGLTEYLAARVLTGSSVPKRSRFLVLVSAATVWALVAAWQADRHPGDALLFGLLRAPCNLLIGVSETAIAVSLIRLSRRSGAAGGLVAATGYAVMVATLPAYPLSFDRPWVRAAGMVIAALGFLLVGWGLLLLLLERRHAELAVLAETLARESSAQATHAREVEQQVLSQAALLAERNEQAELGRLALDLAKDLLTSVDVLRHASSRLQGNQPPAEREALTERLEGVLEDLSRVAAGVLITGEAAPRAASRVDGRQMLELLLGDLVPPTIGVMKAWPGPQVWLTIDETLLSVALHQLIRCQLTADRPVERLSVILTREPDVSVTLQQALSGRSDGEPPTDAIGLKLAQLAIRRLGGSLEIRPGYSGNSLVLRLPSDVVDLSTLA